MNLEAEWYETLRESGFEDIEDKKGYLIQYDRRTIAFDNRDKIRQFYTHLDHYLTDHSDLPPLDYQILTLYSQGVYFKDICSQVCKGKWKVRTILERYKNIILRQIHFEE